MRLYRCVTGLALLTLALAGGGCGFMPQSGSNNKGKLEGTRWVNEPGPFAGIHFIRGAFILDFRGDGTFFWRFSDQTFTGTFSYGPDNLIFFNLSKPFLNRTDWKENITISGDTLIMGGEDNLTITFNRYKGTPSATNKDTPKETAPQPPPETPTEVAATTPKRTATKPEELILGEWGVTESSINGSVKPKSYHTHNRVVFTADKVQFLDHGKPVQEATYKCDFTKDPMHIDLTYLSGDKKGKTELGVVRVTDSMVEFTLAEPGQIRPVEFSSPQGWNRTRLRLYWIK
jgi:uncharacterized protein (TIGR03067 family)